MANINQPTSFQQPVFNWMNRPPPVANCPTGFEYLIGLNKLQVEQLPSLFEALTGWEKNNKYVIRNSSGQQIYFAAEETDACMRICCGEFRGFMIHIIDNNNQEVMRVSREFKCCSGCCWCAGCCSHCAYEITVALPNGTPIGYVLQKFSFWRACYDILDENKQPILRVLGPCCIWDGACCPCDNNFRILGTDEQTEVGKVTKEYAGFIRESFTTADNFSITFPLDLSVKAKATLIGALFLIVKFCLIYSSLKF